MSISKNSIITFVSQIASFAFYTLSSVVLARALGPEGKGIYAIVFLVIMTLADALKFNIDNSTVYYLGTSKHDFTEFFKIYFILAVLLGLAGIGIYFFFRDAIITRLLKEINPTSLDIVVFFLPLYLLDFYLTSAIWGLNEIKKYNFSNVCRPILLTVLLVFSAFFTKDPFWFMIANIAAVFGIVILNYFFLFKHTKSFNPKINLSLIKEMFIYGTKGTVGSLLGLLAYRLGPYLVIYYCGVKAMGYYSVSLYSEFLWFIPFSINVALFPVMSRIDNDSKIALAKQIARNAVFISSVCAFVLIIISRPLINRLYGNEFLPAVIPFCILLPGIAVGSITRALKSFFDGQGKPEINAYVSAATVIAAIILNITFISRMGIIGAALSSLCIYILTATSFVVIFAKATSSKIKEILFINKDDIRFYRNFLGK